MQLWALPAHLPQWKRTVYGVHPRSALREEELGRVQRGGCLFVCSQSATIKNLYPSEKKKDILSLRIEAPLFLQFLPLLRVYFNLLLNPASSCTHFFLPHFTLSLSSCYLTTLAAIHKMAAGSSELEGTEWKPFSNRSRPQHRESQDFLRLVDN